jgi:hypothetical protein
MLPANSHVFVNKQYFNIVTIAKTGEAYHYREQDPTIAAAKVTKSQSDDLADMKLQINQLTDVVLQCDGLLKVWTFFWYRSLIFIRPIFTLKR